MGEKSDDLRRQLADVDAAHLRRLEDLGKVQDRAELFYAALLAIDSMGYDALVRGEHNKLIEAVMDDPDDSGESLIYVDAKGNQRADVDKAAAIKAQAKNKDQADG